MLSEYFVDLHIHTVLSPCGELEMGAPEIIGKALKEGIHVIAVTDHNECSNVSALQDAACSKGLVVLPGIEVQTSEDIHVVLIFPDLVEAGRYQEWLRDGFMNTLNRPEIFGYQLVIDQFNNILEEIKPLLIQGVRYSINEVLSRSRRHGAFSILAHIDRPSFSFPAILGPIPDDLDVDALEISCNLSHDGVEEIRHSYPHRPIIRSSDSHELNRISRENCTKMLLAAPTFQEILMALRSTAGRKILWP